MTTRTANTRYVCGWTLDDTCCSKLAEAFETNPVLAQACVDQAAEILYALSGRQFGVCEVTVRPCMEKCRPSNSSVFGLRWQPALVGGDWINVSCGSCTDSCSCTNVCEVFLPGEVYDVVQVRLDGEVVPPEQYRIDNRNYLVRTEGGCWPTCQNMAADATEVGTWEVTYGRGRPLPVAGQAALEALACELCKACIGDKSCCLPERVTSLTRQGITMALLDPMEFLDRGRTGVYAVDLWLMAVNPKGRSKHAGVYSPDVPLVRTTTWP